MIVLNLVGTKTLYEDEVLQTPAARNPKTAGSPELANAA